MNTTIYIILVFILIFKIINSWSWRYLVCFFVSILRGRVNVIGAEGLLVDRGNPLGEGMEPLWLEPVRLLYRVDANFAIELKLT